MKKISPFHGICSFLGAVFLFCASDAPAHGRNIEQYSANASTLSGIAGDIQKSLKPDARAKVSNVGALPQPMVELINDLSHAQAIDKSEKNYLAKYFGELEAQGGQPAPLPNADNPKYWADNVINEQVSNFNSIAGIMVSLDMAHQILGNYVKYGANAGSINKSISVEDFEKAFATAVRAALDAGITVEGMKGIFEALEKVKVRPAWAIQFVPEGVNLAKLKKAMLKSQTDYFAGR